MLDESVSQSAHGFHRLARFSLWTSVVALILPLTIYPFASQASDDALSVLGPFVKVAQMLLGLTAIVTGLVVRRHTDGSPTGDNPNRKLAHYGVAIGIVVLISGLLDHLAILIFWVILLYSLMNSLIKGLA